MKKYLILILLVLASWARASQTIQLNGNTINVADTSGCGGAISGTPVWALNNVLTATASAIVDTGPSSGNIFVTVSTTSTVGDAGTTGVYFSDISYTAQYQLAYTLIGNGAICLPRFGRYVFFKNKSNYPTTKESLAYILGGVQHTTYLSINTTTALTPNAAIYLTTSALANLSIYNPGSSAINFQLSSSSTVPSNLTTVFLSVGSGQAWSKGVSAGQWAPNANYLWTVNPNTTTGTVEVNW